MRGLTPNRGKCVIYYPRAAAGDAHGQPQVLGEVVGQDGEGGHRQIILKISLKLPNIFVPKLCFTRVVRTSRQMAANTQWNSFLKPLKGDPVNSEITYL